MAVPSSGQLRLRGDIALEIDGSATGSDVSLNTLSSEAGFTAPNGMQEFYGYVDAVLPNAGDISNVTGIGTSSMTVNAYITNDGGATITERGLYFGTNSNCTSNPKYSVAGTTGSFSRTFTGLSSSTTYYMQTYAINSVGEDVGDRCVGVATATPTVGSATSGGFKSCTGSNENDIFASGGSYTNNTGTTITFTMTGSLNICYSTPAGAYVVAPTTFTLGNGSTWSSGASFRRSGGGNGYLVASASGYSSTSYLIFC